MFLIMVFLHSDEKPLYIIPDYTERCLFLNTEREYSIA